LQAYVIAEFPKAKELHAEWNITAAPGGGAEPESVVQPRRPKQPVQPLT